MEGFFKRLSKENLLDEWVDTLDWIFDDNKFSDSHGWNSAYIGNYTKSINKIKDFKIEQSESKSPTFPTGKSVGNRKKTLIKILKSNESKGKDIIRHIRNGIAHGNTTFKNVRQDKSNVLFIEIKDYKKEGGEQTAYLFFPLEYILKLHDVYNEIEKSIRNNKPKGRKTKKHTPKEK